MWRYFGVFCNTATVLLGSGLGVLLRARRRAAPAEQTDGFPPRDRLQDVMMPCLGFCTIFAAASGIVGVESGVQALVVVACMAAGLLIGWTLRIDDRLNRLGDRVLERFCGGGDKANPAEGVVTAILLFCIGSMTVLGSFESAMNPAGALDLSCHTTLLIKSMLDFVSATCLAITFGASVMASAAFVLLFQGLLVALASLLEPFLTRIDAMPALNCVGSLILLAIAVNLLGLRKIKTADYLPALFLPILVCWLLSV